MNLLCFTIYDAATNSYNTPFFMLTKGEALRAFNDLTNDPNSKVNKHPDDYSLLLIGEFNTNDARLHYYGAGDRNRLATARDFIAINATPLNIAKEG